MEQTAVEWLMPNVLELTIQLSNKKISQRTCELKMLELFKEAKAMEKEQIEDAWFDGVTNWDSEKNVEDYINETFKSEKDFSCVQFILDNKTSSATKCICGREKWQHTTLKSE